MGRRHHVLWEVVRVLRVLPSVEFSRRSLSLHNSVRRVRSRAEGAAFRSQEARAVLRRAIVAVDARMPGGGNCVRRSLLEIRLDAGAAQERLFAGFRAGGIPKSGHAWLESHSNQETFDVVISI
ncbi:MAG: lasso peptide biosynthesis protein [Myxococcales bacterium]